MVVIVISVMTMPDAVAMIIIAAMIEAIMMIKIMDMETKPQARKQETIRAPAPADWPPPGIIERIIESESEIEYPTASKAPAEPRPEAVGPRIANPHVADIRRVHITGSVDHSRIGRNHRPVITRRIARVDFSRRRAI